MVQSGVLGLTCRVLSKLVGKISECAVNRARIVSDQSKVSLLAQLKDSMHLGILAFILLIEVLLDQCDRSLKYVTSRLIVLVFITNCQEELLNLAS